MGKEELSSSHPLEMFKLTWSNVRVVGQMPEREMISPYVYPIKGQLGGA